jgi:hypothetical protein
LRNREFRSGFVAVQSVEFGQRVEEELWVIPLAVLAAVLEQHRETGLEPASDSGIVGEEELARDEWHQEGPDLGFCLPLVVSDFRDFVQKVRAWSTELGLQVP